MGVAVAFAGALCCLVALMLPGRTTVTEPPSPEHLAMVAAVWLAALSTVRPWPVGGRLVARVVGVAGAAAAVWWLTDDVRGGLPTAPPVVLAVGALAAVGAAVLHRPRPHRIGPPVAGRALVAAAVVVGLAATAPPLVQQRAFVSATATDAGQAGPRDQARATWAWQPPAAVAFARRTGADVVLGLADGTIEALAGGTGTTTWRYRRPGAFVTALEVAPDGRTVVAAYRASSGRDAPELLAVGLDARLGTVRWQRPVPDHLVGVQGRMRVSDEVLPVWQRVGEDDVEWQGISLRTGHVLWTWRAPSGCTSPTDLTAPGRTTVLAHVDCTDRVGLVGIDDATGRTRWTYTVPYVGAAQQHGAALTHVATTDDGRSALLTFVTVRRAVDAAGAPTLLDTATGAVLDTGPPDTGRWTDVRSGALPLLRPADTDQEAAGGPIVAFDPATGRRHPLDRTGCHRPGRALVTTTDSAFVSLCPDTASAGVVVVQPFGGAPTPVALPAGVTVPRSADDVEVLPLPDRVVLVPADPGGDPPAVVAVQVPPEIAVPR